RATGLPAVDQRGLPRVAGGQVDLGAYQVQAVTVVVTDQTVSFSPDATTVTLQASVTAPGPAVTEGLVNFTVAGQTVSAAVNASGGVSASGTLPAGVAVGAYAITASYSDASPNPGHFRDGQGSGTLSVLDTGTPPDPPEQPSQPSQPGQPGQRERWVQALYRIDLGRDGSPAE